MKKPIILILVLALMLGITCAHAAPEDLIGTTLPDFTAETIDGSTFTLSESLKTHKLVVLNFWATWCGPCCMEFPFLETAWEQYSFAEEYGLKFPIGRDDSGMFKSMEGQYIPTTLIIGPDMTVLSAEVGAKSSPEEFYSLFDAELEKIGE